MMGILCKREKSVAAALPRAPAMTERIVRPAPAHLCGRLVFICEDLWGAAASAAKPGLGIVRRAGRSRPAAHPILR